MVKKHLSHRQGLETDAPGSIQRVKAKEEATGTHQEPDYRRKRLGKIRCKSSAPGANRQMYAASRHDKPSESSRVGQKHKMEKRRITRVPGSLIPHPVVG